MPGVISTEPVTGRTGFITWSSVVAGAASAAALSSILTAFGVAVGLSISSTSPTWRDASTALALLSGLYLVLQAVFAFGLGGYLTGRTCQGAAAAPAAVERTDGINGLLSWALAVLLGVLIVSA